MYFVAKPNEEAKSFIQAAGLTDETQMKAIGTLVFDLKNYNLWDKMKVIYPMVGQAGVSSSFQFNLKNPATFKGTFNGGWNFHPTGAAGNGTTGYMNTGFNAFNDSDIQSNYMSVSAYTNSDLPGAQVKIIGAYDGTRETGIVPRVGNVLQTQINDSVFSGIDASNGASQGFYIANKNNTGNQIGYKNGVRLLNSPNLSTGKTNLSLFVGARNINGSADQFNTYNVQFIHIGLGLTDTEATNLYTAVQRFQTTLGRQV